MAVDPRQREEDITQQRASLLKTGYTDTRQVLDLVPINELLELGDMEQRQVVPLFTTPHHLTLGFTQNTKRADLETVTEKLKGFNVKFSLISDSGYNSLLERYRGQLAPVKSPNPINVSDQLAEAVLEAKTSSQDPELFTKKLVDTRQKELFPLIAQQAYLLGASDIHIEPTPGIIRLRFRIDGTLHQVATLKPERFNLLLSNLQMTSGIKWNANYPQTGHTSLQLIGPGGETVPVNMRVETIPTTYGSDVVIRIFNLDVRFLKLENLGLSDYHHQNIDKLIAHPHGLGLITGPTGSGKTSTLYAILNKLNTAAVKIITLEDPVEYELGGITQIGVDSEQGQSFGERLRAVLREDPDIMMLGEIRDPDTAKTALQAALTGHLVLSTFHANSAVGAVARLLALIGQNSTVASALKLIMAQRLLRKLCEHCKQKYSLSPEEKKQVDDILSPLPSQEHPKAEKFQTFRSKGCNKCYHIGYKGRIMVAEQLFITPAMEKLLTGQASEQQIEELATKEGMVTLIQDAVLKALAGITSLDEVYRVIEV